MGETRGSDEANIIDPTIFRQILQDTAKFLEHEDSGDMLASDGVGFDDLIDSKQLSGKEVVGKMREHLESDDDFTYSLWTDMVYEAAGALDQDGWLAEAYVGIESTKHNYRSSAYNWLNQNANAHFGFVKNGSVEVHLDVSPTSTEIKDRFNDFFHMIGIEGLEIPDVELTLDTNRRDWAPAENRQVQKFADILRGFVEGESFRDLLTTD